MAQKPLLWVEVGAHAVRNRSKKVKVAKAPKHANVYAARTSIGVRSQNDHMNHAHHPEVPTRATQAGTVSDCKGTRFYMYSDDKTSTTHLACTRMTILTVFGFSV
jgi:hypothetical protein